MADLINLLVSASLWAGRQAGKQSTRQTDDHFRTGEQSLYKYKDNGCNQAMKQIRVLDLIHAP